MMTPTNSHPSEPAHPILELERGALDRWGQGDPSGFLEISAPDVTYFDPFLPSRIDGLAALSQYYETLRGTIRIDRFEFVRPRVLDLGTSAILTFNLVCHVGAKVLRWNCTEVYRQDPEGWRIVQTHWSFVRPLASSST